MLNRRRTLKERSDAQTLGVRDSLSEVALN